MGVGRDSNPGPFTWLDIGKCVAYRKGYHRTERDERLIKPFAPNISLVEWPITYDRVAQRRWKAAAFLDEEQRNAGSCL